MMAAMFSNSVILAAVFATAILTCWNDLLIAQIMSPNKTRLRHFGLTHLFSLENGFEPRPSSLWNPIVRTWGPDFSCQVTIRLVKTPHQSSCPMSVWQTDYRMSWQLVVRENPHFVVDPWSVISKTKIWCICFSIMYC